MDELLDVSLSDLEMVGATATAITATATATATTSNMRRVSCTPFRNSHRRTQSPGSTSRSPPHTTAHTTAHTTDRAAMKTPTLTSAVATLAALATLAPTPAVAEKCVLTKLVDELAPITPMVYACYDATHYVVIPPSAQPTAAQLFAVCTKCPDLIAQAQKMTFNTCTFTVSGVDIPLNEWMPRIISGCSGGRNSSSNSTSSTAGSTTNTVTTATVTPTPSPTSAGVTTAAAALSVVAVSVGSAAASLLLLLL